MYTLSYNNDEIISTKVTNEEIAEGIEDEYGVVYSRNGKRLLKCRNHKISDYVIKDGTLAICDNAFYDCESLTSVVIPESVSSIGDWAFGRCSISAEIEKDLRRRFGDSLFDFYSWVVRL